MFDNMFDNHGHFEIANRADLLEAIALTGAIGQAHLMRALMHGRIAYLPLLPAYSSSKFRQFIRRTASGPSVVSIGDDDVRDRGPAGWHCAERAVRWATAVLIHGAGAEVSHYEGAIRAFERGARVLFIECGSATLGAWMALVAATPPRPSTVVIRPRQGVHPLPTRSVQ